MKNNKVRKAALYDPYLDTLGGGEQYVLSAMKALEEDGYEVTVFWKDDLQEKIKEKFGITFKDLTTDSTGFGGSKSAIERWWNLGNYDVFLYITDGSYFFSGAKTNFVYAMVPSNDIYQVDGGNKFKLAGWKFIANSKFTAAHLRTWGIDSEVHYPYLSQEFFKHDIPKKEKIILNVGRFFGHLHKKNHAEIIAAFNVLQKQKEFADYKLILAGGMRDEDKDYFEAVKKLAEANPSIELHPNIPRVGLISLYEKAQYYWHFTGMGVNVEEHPEQVEHLGITPLEAMAAGAVVFCYRAGGPLEIIQQGKNGFLFSTQEELISQITALTPEKTAEITHYAREFVTAHFSYTAFKNELRRIVEGK